MEKMEMISECAERTGVSKSHDVNSWLLPLRVREAIDLSLSSVW
jgi:hypothetical protein